MKTVNCLNCNEELLIQYKIFVGYEIKNYNLFLHSLSAKLRHGKDKFIRTTASNFLENSEIITENGNSIVFYKNHIIIQEEVESTASDQIITIKNKQELSNELSDPNINSLIIQEYHEKTKKLVEANNAFVSWALSMMTTKEFDQVFEFGRFEIHNIVKTQ